jgi:uncharacterized protein with LGFP repeats
MPKLAILLFLIPLTAFADRLVLKNGKEYRGTFVDADGGVVTFRVAPRTVRTFKAADITHLEIGPKTTLELRRSTAVQEADRSMRARTPVPTAQAQPAPPPADPAPSPQPFVTPPEIGTVPTNPIQGAAAIDSEFTRTGSETGLLGSARAPHQPTADGRASVRVYNNGSIYWTPAAGAHAIAGPIFQAWLAQGGERSRLGYPINDEKVSDAGATRQQDFENGRILWSDRDGARITYSAAAQ